MRLFGAERIMNMMDTLKIDEDTPIDQKILSNAIESAQKKVESVHFQQRKNVLEYDDVMNTQRKVIYEQRQKVLDGDDLQSNIHSMLEGVIDEAVNAALGEHDYLSDREQLEHLLKPFEGVYFAEGAFGEADLEDLTKQALKDRILKLAEQTYAAKEQELGSPIMRELERVITLRVVDEYWMEQIDSMQDLRQGIVLRAYGQNNPVIEYKREGYEMFSQMISAIREETIRRLFRGEASRPRRRSSGRRWPRTPLRAVPWAQAIRPSSASPPCARPRSAATTPAPAAAARNTRTAVWTRI